jgi:hypothetical protein
MYYKGCESCQKFRDVQLAPIAMLHPIIKRWSFRGWALDFIGQIHSASSKSHQFVLVATDYFTKWMEVVPLKNMTHKEVIHFILEHIVHRFGIPQTLTTDQSSSVNLPSLLRPNSLVLYHTTLRPIVQPSLVTRL